MADIIQLRRDTKANWATKNPVLAIGETGLEIDTRKVKYGDGTTTWNDLPYSGGADYGSYDVSEANNGAVYATLQNALTALPVTERKGGMNIRFIDATTNSYVEYRYMAVSTDDSIFLSTGNWQGIDETPTEGSNNLVKSGSIYSELKRQDEAIERLNGNDVVVVEDHTDVENPDPQKIYREQGTDSYTDWMYVDGEWKIISIYTFPGIDNYPAEDSDNLVKSKGIHKAISDAKNDVIGNASDSYNTLGKIEDRIKENEEERDEQIENLIDGATDDYDTLGKIEERVKEESSNRDAAIEELKGGASQYGDTLKKLEERIDTETYERIDQIAESEGNLIDGASDDSNTLKKLEIKINSETSRAKSVEDTKANKATTLAGYGITDGYTKNEGEVFENYVNRTIAVQQAKIDSINGNEVIVVANHSSVSSPKTNTIYREQGTDSYTDWMYAEGVGWKKIATYDFPGMDNVPTSGSQKLLSSDTILTHGNAIDVSILNANVNTNPATPSTYNSLSEALAAVPATSRKGGMSIKFIQTTPAKYTVIKTEGATERPTGTELQSDPGIISGTYTAGELSSFSTLPATLNSSLTYYLTVIETVDEQEVTTYTTWVITYVQSSDNKYEQWKLKSNSFVTTLTQWEYVGSEYIDVDVIFTQGKTFSLRKSGTNIIINFDAGFYLVLNALKYVNVNDLTEYTIASEQKLCYDLSNNTLVVTNIITRKFNYVTLFENMLGVLSSPISLLANEIVRMLSIKENNYYAKAILPINSWTVIGRNVKAGSIIRFFVESRPEGLNSIAIAKGTGWIAANIKHQVNLNNIDLNKVQEYILSEDVEALYLLCYESNYVNGLRILFSIIHPKFDTFSDISYIKANSVTMSEVALTKHFSLNIENDSQVVDNNNNSCIKSNGNDFGTNFCEVHDGDNGGGYFKYNLEDVSSNIRKVKVQFNYKTNHQNTYAAIYAFKNQSFIGTAVKLKLNGNNEVNTANLERIFTDSERQNITRLHVWIGVSSDANRNFPEGYKCAVTNLFQVLDGYDIYHADNPTTTVITVAPSSGDFTSIRSAIESISDNSETKRYEIHVKPGTYNEIDILTKDYVDVIGEDINQCIVITNGLSTENSPSNYHIGGSQYSNVPINTIPKAWKHQWVHMTNATVSNLTCIAEQTKYVVHQDTIGTPYKATFKNCRFIKREDYNDSSNIWDKVLLNIIGIGAYGGQFQIYDSCEFRLEVDNLPQYPNVSDADVFPSAVFFHNWNNKTRPCGLTLKDCNIYGTNIVNLSELGSNQDDIVTLYNVKVDGKQFGCVMSSNANYYTDAQGERVTDPLLIPYNIKVNANCDLNFILYKNRPLGYGVMCTPDCMKLVYVDSALTGQPISLDTSEGYYTHTVPSTLDNEYGIACADATNEYIFVSTGKKVMALCTAGTYTIGGNVYYYNGKFTSEVHGNPVAVSMYNATITTDTILELLRL